MDEQTSLEIKIAARSVGIPPESLDRVRDHHALGAPGQDDKALMAGLAKLDEKITRRAETYAQQILRLAPAINTKDPDSIMLPIAGNDLEAQYNGWPLASVDAEVIARTIFLLNREGLYVVASVRTEDSEIIDQTSENNKSS